MFRRKGSDAKKETPKGSDRDSTSSAGSGGIMNSMKAVINKGGRAVEAPESSSNKAVKDGSAHPHAGSDARVRSYDIENDYEL